MLDTRRWWIRPVADTALWVVLGTVTVVELGGLRGGSYAAEAGALVLALAAAAYTSRRWPHTALGVVLAAATVEMTASGIGLASGVLTPLLSVAVFAFLTGHRSGRVGPVATMNGAAVLATLAVQVASAVAFDHDTRAVLTGLVDWMGGALAVTLSVAAPWLFGRYRRWYGRLTRGGWDVAERMERARAADADRARLRERARIAARMHDSLGHDLALIAVRAAALEMTADDGSEESGRRSAAAELRASAHEANMRLREIIGVLRGGPEGPDGTPPPEPVPALVERAADAGLSVRLLREGPDPDPATRAGRAVHRVVQEALTNAAKYAPGAEVTVHVLRDRDGVRVRVEDTGSDRASVVPGRDAAGSGLAGLRAFVEGAGGRFGAGPRGGGFEVRAAVPDTGAEASDTSDGPDSPDGAETALADGTRTRRLQAEARDHSRRLLVTAVAVPAALGLSVACAGFLILGWVGGNSVLPPERYGRLSVGDLRSAVEEELPRFAYPADSVDDPPPEPAGADCRFYLARWENGLPPVYRLCFADGVLVDKAEIDREQ